MVPFDHEKTDQEAGSRSQEASLDYPDKAQIDPIVGKIMAWAALQTDIRAIALVGSCARGAARPDSDIDFVVLTREPSRFRADAGWVDEIGWHVRTRQDEDYGVAWSRRIVLEPNGTEVEVGFAALSWACIAPVDPGTRQVILHGCRVLYDPDGLLARLCKALDCHLA